MTATRSRVYHEGALIETDIDEARLLDVLSVEGNVVWIDLEDPTEAELHRLADHLGLHELAVEDALEAHRRPKLDHFPDHLFLTCQATRVEPATGELLESQVSCFISERWLITVRNGGILTLDEVLDRWDRSPDLAVEGVSFLLYGLLDVVIDGYFEAVESFDEYYDTVSEQLFDENPIEAADQLNWFQMRRSLARLHRLAVPLRETVNSLMRREHGLVSPGIYPYYQDVYDHILRVSETTDALRDLMSTIVETNLSLRDYRQNQVMKKVTSWAAIIAVPTLITGFYGMNVPYPGFGHHSGLLVATLLMAAISGFLYLVFRRNEWL